MKVLNGERGCRDIGVTVFGGGGEGRVPTQRLSDSRVNETVKHSIPCAEPARTVLSRCVAADYPNEPTILAHLFVLPFAMSLAVC